MTRGDKGRYKKKSRSMVRAKDKSSDESDEDYMVAEDEEEVRESEDEYCLGSDGDDSEEILGELEEEEEEDFVEKKAKKVGRSNVNKGARSRGRKKNGIVKAKTKRRASHRVDEDEDDDDEDDADYDFHDEKINKVAKPREKKKVSYREEDDEYDVTDGDYDDVKVNKTVRRRKKKRVSYREHDDEYDGTDGDLDGMKVDEVVKPRKKRRVSYGEEDDDYDGMDGDFEDVKVSKVVKSRNRKRVSYREDDDYDGTDDDFDDVKVNTVVKSREKRRVSYREDDDYDGTDDEFDDVKVNKVVKSREKKRVSYKEEDEDEDVDVKNDDFDYEKLDGVAKPRKEKGVSHREEDDEYDGVDDNDDDDDEFALDEIDGVDDEDEFPVVTKKKRVGRRRIQGKGISKGRKRTRNSSKGLKKNEIKKPKSNLRQRRKGITGTNGEFLDAKPIVEEKNKKVNGRRRKRRLYIHSDSDFVSSGSSDYEFTISEEEREQIREANLFCRRFTTNLRTSSNKLEEVKHKPAQRKRPAKKGKEKVEDLNVEAAKQVCGICLTEEGKKTVRGTLSCCSHYFCFACIMEWSKVESRCPLCKQRFVTISKPARSNTGFDLRTVAIQIPERDQVYQPSEEELQGFFNPYDDVICIECHQGGDDALMLLCDLCDSPAHTYCVGLGHEVPEGNWYCEGCRPTALDSSNPQVLTPPPDYRTNSNLSVGLSPGSSIRETFDLNEMYVPETPLTQGISQLPSPRPSVGDIQLPSPASGSGALTVLGRRRIQRQIHQFLNSRRRQMDDRNSETQATMFGHSLFRSQVGQSLELATQHTVTSERIPSNEIYFHESLQENTVPLLQNPRLTHMRGQPCQNQPSTSSNGSFGGFSHNEFSGINSRNGLGLDHQQLQPCSSRLNIGCDASTSSFNVEKDQVQSMVKNHLTSLSKDLKLGYNTFKDIARSSTHTILAACGIEHRWNEVYHVQTPLTCTHAEKGHCSSCFDLFVRNVVIEITNTRVATASKD